MLGKDDPELCDVARHKLLCSLWAVRYIEERESCALMPFHRAGAGRGEGRGGGAECEYDNVYRYGETVWKVARKRF